MSWDELDDVNPNRLTEKREKAIELAKNYSRCFATEEGKKVLEHLVNTYVMESNIDHNTQNIDYVAAYKNGEAGLVKMILNQLKRAQTI